MAGRGFPAVWQTALGDEHERAWLEARRDADDAPAVGRQRARQTTRCAVCRGTDADHDFGCPEA
jgi:hypothetical protein